MGLMILQYGDKKQEWAEAYASKDDRYPKTTTAACDVLAVVNDKPRNKARASVQAQANTPRVEVHAQAGQSSTNNMVCFKCGTIGHGSNKCQKTVPKNEWWLKKTYDKIYGRSNQAADDGTVASHLTGVSNSGSSAVGSQVNTQTAASGWSGFQCVRPTVCQPVHNTVANKKDQGQVITLDSGSTISIFGDPSLVNQICCDETGLIMDTNAGSMDITHKAHLPSFGDVWYDEQAIANLFALKDMVQRYRVEYDSSKEDAFLVHLNPTKVVKFKNNGKGLYQFKGVPCCSISCASPCCYLQCRSCQ